MRSTGDDGGGTALLWRENWTVARQRGQAGFRNFDAPKPMDFVQMGGFMDGKEGDVGHAACKGLHYS